MRIFSITSAKITGTVEEEGRLRITRLCDRLEGELGEEPLSIKTQRVSLTRILETKRELKCIIRQVGNEWFNLFEDEGDEKLELAQREWDALVRRPLGLFERVAELESLYEAGEGCLFSLSRKAETLGRNILLCGGCRPGVEEKRVSYNSRTMLCVPGQKTLYIPTVFLGRVESKQDLYRRGDGVFRRGEGVLAAHEWVEACCDPQEDDVHLGHTGLLRCLLTAVRTVRKKEEMEVEVAQKIYGFISLELECLLGILEDIPTQKVFREMLWERLQSQQERKETINAELFKELTQGEIVDEALVLAPEYETLYLEYKEGRWVEEGERALTVRFFSQPVWESVKEVVNLFFDDGEVFCILFRRLRLPCV